MGKRGETLSLLRSGLDPIQISIEQRVGLATTLGYLDEFIGKGKLRRSDVFFSLSREQRNDPKSLEEHQIVARYGDAAHALGDLYEDLRCVEVTLHEQIRKALESQFGSGDAGWWRKGLPEQIRARLADRRERDDDPDHPYAYTDLLDLWEILDRNWGKVAKEVVPHSLPDKARLERDFRRLNKIRNRVMHPVRSRSPSESDFEAIREIRQRLSI